MEDDAGSDIGIGNQVELMLEGHHRILLSQETAKRMASSEV
jgi:hypothetical protein